MDAGFCTSCGEKTLALKSKEKSKKTVMLISIALIAVAAIGLVLWFVLRDDSPNTAEGWLAQGERYLFAQNYEQAVVAFRKVIEIEPRNPRGYTGAADAYTGLGQPDKAADVLRQGLIVLPDNPAITTRLKDIIEEHKNLRVNSDPLPDKPTPPSQDNDDPPPAVLPEESWAEAYAKLIREYDTFVFETVESDPDFGRHEYTWRILGDIQYAELIDIDNNGTPELILIAYVHVTVNDNGYEYDYEWTSLLVFSHNGLSDGLMNLYYTGIYDDIDSGHSIATTSDGLTYILNEIIGTDIGNFYGATYYSINNGEWIINLYLTSYTEWYNEDYENPLTEEKYFINGEPVEADLYEETIHNLGIIEKKSIGYLSTNDIQAFLDELDQTVVPTR